MSIYFSYTRNRTLPIFHADSDITEFPFFLNKSVSSSITDVRPAETYQFVDEVKAFKNARQQSRLP